MEWKKCDAVMLGKSVENDGMKLLVKFVSQHCVVENIANPTELDIYRYILNKILTFETCLSNVAGLDDETLQTFYGQDSKVGPQYLDFTNPSNIISLADAFDFTIIIYQCSWFKRSEEISKYIDGSSFNELAQIPPSDTTFCFMVEWQQSAEKTRYFSLWHIQMLHACLNITHLRNWSLCILVCV